jgi:hypothetical protein
MLLLSADIDTPLKNTALYNTAIVTGLFTHTRPIKQQLLFSKPLLVAKFFAGKPANQQANLQP